MALLPHPIPPLWQDPIDAWLSHLKTAGQTPQTIDARRLQLRSTARLLGPDPWAVTDEDVTLWAASRNWAPETRRCHYAALRKFYDWATLTGRATRSPTGGLPHVKPAEPTPRPCPDHVYANALGIADPRTRTILRLAAELGMRRFEIAQINTRDLAEDLFGPTLRVHGKGHKVRILPIPTDLAKRIEEAAGWLFPGNENGHLSARRVGELGRDALTEGWTLHTLRHRFATRAHRATADLLSVQRLLGHSSPATTQRYIARDMERLRNVMAAAG